MSEKKGQVKDQKTAPIAAIDYKAIGLKCGIEIHQRLGTDKLFCSCPSTLREDKPHFTIKRELRASAGETGEMDVAASHESKKDEYYLYEGYNDTTCLVELDEEPPQPMNRDALKVVLQICKMLNAKIVDEIQVMRKTVVNGSNTSGFQRTALVGIGGTLDTPQGHIGMPNIQIEEEAAKDVEKGIDGQGRNFVIFRLDRLGIPLIELGTDPDIKTPEQAKEVCERIGMILRSTGKVARGIGTIRQDVNISIAEGDRIEIKGAQDLKMIPTWVDYEARRQLTLVAVAKKVKDLNPTQNSKEVTDIFKNTDCKFVKKAIGSRSIVLGAKLEGFAGILGIETCPGRRIGSELSDYAKMKAGVGGIIHSDEKLDKYRFTEEEIDKTRQALDCKDNDTFILVVAPKNKSSIAVEAAIDRAVLLKDGVLKEVRKPNPDGTSSFMRPMPGAARMYPETDIRPIIPDLSDIELPELLEDKAARYEKEFKLSADLAKALTRSNMFTLFEHSVKTYKNIKPAFIGETLISAPKNIRRKHKIETDNITDADFERIFDRLDKGALTKDPVEDILLAFAKGESVDYDQYTPLPDEDLETEIKKILGESKEIEFKMIVGKVMGKLKGKAEGRKIMEFLKKLVPK